MKQIVFILLDGLTRDSAKRNMGYLWHLVENKQAGYIEVKGELPSLSRPCYESIFTGTPAYTHGITANNIASLSKLDNIFSLAHQKGLKTGAAAYYWVSELYNSAPFDHLHDRVTCDETKNIQHGMFYFDDAYPDSHLFLDGENMREKYGLDLLLIHPMGLDFTGHRFGSKSKEYESKAVEMDVILANLIPIWLSKGYGIIVTSDHGMSELGNHGGNRRSLRNVFAYFINLGTTDDDSEYSQLSLAPTVCGLLGLDIPKSMKDVPIPLK